MAKARNSACSFGNAECDNEISCFRKIAGTLTGDEIKKHEIISMPPSSYAGDQDSFKSTTYDLRLGDSHYVYNGVLDEGSANWELVFIGDDERLKERNKLSPPLKQQKGNLGTLIIPPFGSALVQLEEIVDTYTLASNNILVVGRFDLKLSRVHQALISQQATQVEPCYQGQLFCFLHNFSNKAIRINYKDRVATIEFSYVSCFCNEKKKNEIIDKIKKQNAQKYDDEFCYKGRGISDIRWFARNNRLPDDCGLATFNKQFDKQKKDIDLWLNNSKDKFNENLKSFLGEAKTITEVANQVDKTIKYKHQIAMQWGAVALALITGLSGIFATLYKYDTINQEIEKAKTTINAQNLQINDLQQLVILQDLQVKNMQQVIDDVKTNCNTSNSNANASTQGGN